VFRFDGEFKLHYRAAMLFVTRSVHLAMPVVFHQVPAELTVPVPVARHITTILYIREISS